MPIKKVFYRKREYRGTSRGERYTDYSVHIGTPDSEDTPTMIEAAETREEDVHFFV